MRIVTNHVYSLKDKENLIDQTNLKNEDQVIDIFGDLAKLEHELSDYGQHFFDCLRFLMKEGRLEILPVKFNGIDLAHSKKMILFDGENYISTDGSINFTLNALTKNSESFEVNAPWEGEIFAQRTQDEKENFDKIFAKSHSNYEYISAEKIEVVINRIGKPREAVDLIDDSITLDQSNYSEKVSKILRKKESRVKKTLWDYQVKNNIPRFPFPSGPRDYQKKAYLNWCKNKKQGIFGMATGTGKTLTALNCLLAEYEETGKYMSVILVPTSVLLSQWVSEVRAFGFDNIITSDNKDWPDNLGMYLLLSQSKRARSFIFISTYASFNGKKYQGITNGKDLSKVLLIADEAHNLGTKSSLSNLPVGMNKRIGLSATPSRKYDEKGTKELESFFNSFAPYYTYSFSMKQAIDEGYLTRYFYYPILTSLTHEELMEYKRISKQLLKHFDFQKGRYKESAEMLLIKRKRIIHQAKNKKEVFKEILEKINKNDKLSHTLVYVPEGYDHDYSNTTTYNIKDEDERIINDYSEIISRSGYSTYQILSGTKDRDQILKRFDQGEIQVLTSMKTLDEGVDVPSSKYAIFCSSTGNPRQFIQRRGRVLRLFEGKDYAYVYDIVIAPNSNMWLGESFKTKELLNKMEKNIFTSELYRIANFLYACENRSDISLGKDKELKRIVQLSKKYDVNLSAMILDLLSQDETK